MAHQEAVACIGRRTWVDRSRDTVERRQRQPIATVRHIKQQAVVATPRIFGSEDANIRRKMNTAVAIARSQLDIGDAAIEGMSGIHREMRRPVELDVMADGTEIPPARERLSCLDFQGRNRHRAPPSVLGRNAAPDPRTKSNLLAELKTRLNSRTPVGNPVGARGRSPGSTRAP
jgi:hypothetical protein